MKKRLGMALLSTTLGLAGLGLASPRFSEHCAAGQDTIYILDWDGKRYSGRYQCYGGVGADGSRWTCIGTVIGCSPDPCGSCHTTAETTDRRYMATYSRSKHRTVHYPSLIATLIEGKNLQVHESAYLRLVNREIALTLSGGKDAAVFPAGSTVLLNRVREPRLIALPTGGEPKVFP